MKQTNSISKIANLLPIGIIVFVVCLLSTACQQPHSNTTATVAKKNKQSLPQHLQKGDKGSNTPGRWSFHTQRAYPEKDINYESYQQAWQQAKAARETAETQQQGNWKLVGPENVGGRITDIEMPANDTLTIYAAAASGGIFKSNNQGETWKPIFDEQASLSIGDIALAPSNPNIVYVGTGEANAGGGSITYDGVGVFKSLDGGTTWTDVGLDKTRNIGRVAVHPTNPDTVFVAAMGNLFANNKERGVFRSINGGQSWEKTLYVSDSTGCVDIAINPKRHQLVYAATWERIRRKDARQYGGQSCGIYRSEDGGTTWSLITNGLPQEDLGRIGLQISPSHPHIMYAVYANEEGLFKGIYKSVNYGEEWYEINTNRLENAFSNYGWWFGNIRLDPHDPNTIYVLGLDVYKTTNGGGHWQDISWNEVHYDQHGMYIHPQNADLVVLGNDGGVYMSKDAGDKWTHFKNLPITQFYTCTIDPQDANIYYGGAQDNGIIRTLTGKTNDWEHLVDGDGFAVIVDPTDQDILYTAYQYGNLLRTDDGGVSFYDGQNGIDLADYRNWNTPIVLDKSNPNRLYYGTNRVYRSNSSAESWTPISPPLSTKTTAEKVVYGTTTVISIAPNACNILYVGTDDGNVWRANVDNKEWVDVSKGLPKQWVTGIAVHPQNEQMAYVTFSGYRTAQYTPHVFKTIDGGQTWKDVSSNLPEAPINDVLIDAQNPKHLFLGTDLGVFVSYNEGLSWQMLGHDLPNVPVIDMDIHAEEGILLAATYGRSLYTFDLNQLKETPPNRGIPSQN